MLCLGVGLSGCVKPLPEMRLPEMRLPEIRMPSIPLPSIGLHRAQPASDRAAVLGGSLVLAAPPGYCVDPTALQDAPEGAFVLWGNCAAIAGDPKGAKPAEKAMLSATIGPLSRATTVASARGYERFFRSEAGRAALARSGLAQDVKILAVKREGGLLLLKIADRSAPTEAPVDDVYWRAITRFDGRVSALSVLPLAGSTMEDETQIALLQAFDETIRAAN